MNSNIVFVAGGKDDEKGIPTVAALRVDPKSIDIGTVASVFQIPVKEFSIVWSMERLPGSDLLFLGGYGHISVVLFDRYAFQQIAILATDLDRLNDPILEMKMGEDQALYFMRQPSTFLEKIQISKPSDSNQQDSSKGFVEAYKSLPINDNQSTQLSSIFRSGKVSQFEIPAGTDFFRVSADGSLLGVRCSSIFKLLRRTGKQASDPRPYQNPGSDTPTTCRYLLTAQHWISSRLSFTTSI
jgi:hypothetical protein